MPFTLPPAPKKYDQNNENQARRTMAAELSAAIERLIILEATPVGGSSDPVAAFSFTQDFLVVHFTDESEAPSGTTITGRVWDFGDGIISTAANNPTPTHTYPDAGTYTVELTITDSDGNSHSVEHDVTVEEDSTTEPLGAPALLIWGTDPRIMPARFDWWNGIQAANMQPGDCENMLDYCADNGLKTFVRLWRTNFVVDANGNFQLSLWQNDVDRYDTPTLRAKIEQRSQDGTIIGHIMADDILSARIWGTSAPLQGALLDNMAAYSLGKFPSCRTIVRARVFQVGSYDFRFLDAVNAQYVFGRGGVSQGSLTQQQWRVADVTAYADEEEADLAALPGNAGADMDIIYGLNVVNGGDETSGIPGDGSPAGTFAMGAQELVDYGAILIPRTKYMFSMWERGENGDQDSYFDRTDIAAACNTLRNLCDAEGV